MLIKRIAAAVCIPFVAMALLVPVPAVAADKADKPGKADKDKAAGPTMSGADIKKMIEDPAKAPKEKAAAIKAVRVTDIATARAFAEGFKAIQDKNGQGSTGNAILFILSCITEAAVLSELKSDIMNKEWPLRVRGAFFKSLATDTSDEMSKFFHELADDQVATLRVLSIEQLGKRAYAPAFDTVAARLEDASWRVKASAVFAMAEYGKRGSEEHKDRAIGLLINMMQQEKGRILGDVAAALKRITGEDHGVAPEAWREWYRKAKNKDAKKRDDSRITKTKYYGLDSYSTQVIYVIDMSVSMLDPVDPEKAKRNITGGKKGGAGAEKKEDEPKDDARRPIDWSKVKCKLDLAKEELLRTIEALPDDVYFNIIAYSTKVEKWQDQIIQANKKNKEEAVKYVNALKCTKLTNIYGALDMALSMCEANYDDDAAAKVKEKKGKQVTGKKEERVADTIWFLTDGFATVGKYCQNFGEGKASKEDTEAYTEEMLAMLEEIRQRNELSRITINAIGIGKEEVDVWTLKRLARENGGEFVKIGDGDADHK